MIVLEHAGAPCKKNGRKPAILLVRSSAGRLRKGFGAPSGSLPSAASAEEEDGPRGGTIAAAVLTRIGFLDTPKSQAVLFEDR